MKQNIQRLSYHDFTKEEIKKIKKRMSIPFIKEYINYINARNKYNDKPHTLSELKQIFICKGRPERTPRRKDCNANRMHLHGSPSFLRIGNNDRSQFFLDLYIFSPVTQSYISICKILIMINFC